MSDVPFVVPLILAVADCIVAAADELTALDAAIGDGDHGLNMKRGFLAVAAALAETPPASDAEALKRAGTTLVMTVGGASGPLYGTLFLTLGKELAARFPSSAPPPSADDRAGLAAVFDAAVAAVAARGKAAAGDKTLLDVLLPAAAAFREGADAAAVAAVAAAAAAATVPLKALRGRAAFLGERSIGHMDPGARSAALMLAAIAATLQTA